MFSKNSRKHVCLVVTNDVVNDPRVDRIASTLCKRYDVTVVGLVQGRQVSTEGKPYRLILVRSPKLLLRKGLRRLLSRALFGTQHSFVHYEGGMKPDRVVSRPSFSARSFIGDLARYGLVKSYGAALKHALRKIKAHVYVANDLDTLSACVYAAKKHQAKLIYDAHELWTEMGFISVGVFKRLMELEEDTYIKKADVVMTVNSSIAEELKRRYSLSSNPRVIYNIPLTTSAAGSNIRRKTSDKINLVYCGRYEASRGLPELIEAMQYLPESYELHLQGYGSLEFALKEQAKKLGLEHRIHFRSPVKKEQIVESLKFADVGVIAYQPVNLNNLYCTPNKLFEYIAAGLAIVASDVPELRKIVEKYHLGYLFNPYEPKDIASAIRKISSEKLPGLQKNARDAAAVLNWKNEEKKLFAIYEEVLN